MHWTKSTTFDESLAAPEKTFLGAENIEKAVHEAIRSIENENSKFKNVLYKIYTLLKINPANLDGLIAIIPFQQAIHSLDCSENRSSPKMGQLKRPIGPKKNLTSSSELTISGESL